MVFTILNTKENLDKLNAYLEEIKEDDIDILDLIKYISNHYGLYYENDIKQERLKNIVPLYKKVLLILVDGLGYYKIGDLNDNSILKNNLKMPLQTVNPTSTACVLTSIASGMYPVEHGILGWWQYSKKHVVNYYPLLFCDKAGENLKNRNIMSKDIFRFDNIFDKYNCDVNLYMNRNIINSDYSKTFTGEKANTYGTYSIRDAFNKISTKISETDKRSFNYLYIDGLDMASHIYGTESKEVHEIIEEIENGIEKVKEKDKDTTIIVIADHGQVDMTSLIYLNQNHDYSKYFYALPSIDTRMISFFVKEEFKEEFENTFCNEFNKDVILLTKKQALDYNLFGNVKCSENFENSCGEYIGVIVNNKFMVCDKITMEDKMSTKGNHSGLTKEERTIPLIVI